MLLTRSRTLCCNADIEVSPVDDTDMVVRVWGIRDPDCPLSEGMTGVLDQLPNRCRRLPIYPLIQTYST